MNDRKSNSSIGKAHRGGSFLRSNFRGERRQNTSLAKEKRERRKDDVFPLWFLSSFSHLETSSLHSVLCSGGFFFCMLLAGVHTPQKQRRHFTRRAKRRRRRKSTTSKLDTYDVTSHFFIIETFFSREQEKRREFFLFFLSYVWELVLPLLGRQGISLSLSFFFFSSSSSSSSQEGESQEGERDRIFIIQILDFDDERAGRKHLHFLEKYARLGGGLFFWEKFFSREIVIIPVSLCCFLKARGWLRS